MAGDVYTYSTSDSCSLICSVDLRRHLQQMNKIPPMRTKPPTQEPMIIFSLLLRFASPPGEGDADGVARVDDD